MAGGGGGGRKPAGPLRERGIIGVCIAWEGGGGVWGGGRWSSLPREVRVFWLGFSTGARRRGVPLSQSHTNIPSDFVPLLAVEPQLRRGGCCPVQLEERAGGAALTRRGGETRLQQAEHVLRSEREVGGGGGQRRGGMVTETRGDAFRAGGDRRSSGQQNPGRWRVATRDGVQGRRELRSQSDPSGPRRRGEAARCGCRFGAMSARRANDAV